MRFKLILIAGLLMSALAARDASADQCSLYVSPRWDIGVGMYFSYVIHIPPPPELPMPHAGPWPPPPPALTIKFHGTNNGVNMPEGEVYPGTFYYGDWNLTGYYNPGGISGYYTRNAEITYKNYNNETFTLCSTNSVWVYLY